MTSIKGVKGFVPLLENTYNTPVQRYFKSDKGKQALANSCSKYQKKQYHCEICNRDMKLGGRARHNQSKIHLLKSVKIYSFIIYHFGYLFSLYD